MPGRSMEVEWEKAEAERIGGACRQHPFLVRCAHFGERVIYEAGGSREYPVTSVVWVDNGLATKVLAVPHSLAEHDGILDDGWQHSEDWLRGSL